jgi:hypothetical protein
MKKAVPNELHNNGESSPSALDSEKNYNCGNPISFIRVSDMKLSEMKRPYRIDRKDELVVDELMIKVECREAQSKSLWAINSSGLTLPKINTHLILIRSTKQKSLARACPYGYVLPNGEFVHHSKAKFIRKLEEA